MTARPTSTSDALPVPEPLLATVENRNSGAAEFSFLRDQLAIKDADLSKQMKKLVDAEYVSSSKDRVGRGGKRWFRITKKGRKAFNSHFAALQAMVEITEQGSTTSVDPKA